MQSHAYKGHLSTYNVKVFNYFHPGLQLFFSILNTYMCKHKIHSHQSCIYYDMPGNKIIIIVLKT